MHKTPNQHLLTLPSSPVGKSSDLHAGVQQFKSHSGHNFFFYIHSVAILTALFRTLEKNKIGFLIFAFVLEIRPILFPHTLLWGVLATPNQHLLTLPSSPVGKSSDLHAGVQQFKSHSGHKFFFFFHTYSPVVTHSPISDNFST